MNVSVSRRYARALVDVAVEQGRLDEVGRQIQALAAALKQNPELGAVASDPKYSRDQQWSVMGQVLQLQGATNPLVSNLVRVLIDRHRLSSLPEIARIYGNLADARAGRLRGEITSAVPLPQEDLSRLEDALERLTRCEVVLESRLDPAILGGVSARLGSMLYDGSLKSQLEELRSTLKRV
ncbi:MAG TPA: ATP synthase F1 subunit delta [Myxococcaceae bacterium]|nr:ATP synthase F1 subunit delta [Myxococcaceae bacterium]